MNLWGQTDGHSRERHFRRGVKERANDPFREPASSVFKCLAGLKNLRPKPDSSKNPGIARVNLSPPLPRSRARDESQG
jgi:hypothetical protein